MSRSRKKFREQDKPRSVEALDMFLNCHAKSWDPRDRKKKEHKKDWMKEIDNDLD